LLRATPWPLVSAPLTWDEVEAAASAGNAGGLFFSPAHVLERVASFGDLFAAAAGRKFAIAAT